ncbi:MAG: glycosyltransferase family 39 protein [Thermoleophilia bacterium]
MPDITVTEKQLTKAYTGALLPLIVLAGALARFFELGVKSLWYDELYTVWSSRLPLVSLVQEEAAARHPPVYYVLGHFWFSLFPGDAGVRSISCAAGIAVIYLTFLTGRELFSLRVGLWAASLAAASPFLIWSSREATYYSWVTFISLFSFYLLLRAMNSGGSARWIGYTIVTSVALFSYFFSPVLIAAQLCVFLLLRNRESASRPFVACLCILVAETMALAALAMAYRVPGMIKLTTLPSAMWRMAEDLVVSPFIFVAGSRGSTVTWGKGIILIVGILALVAALIFSDRLRLIFRNRRLGVLALYTFLLVFGAIALHAVLDDYTGAFRFYSWAVPPFAILIAVLIVEIPKTIRLETGAVLITAIIIFAVLPILRQESWDMRDVMNIIATNQQDKDGLLCFPLHHCVVAASQYPTGLVPTGGSLDGDHVSLTVGGWNGYLIRQTAQASWLSENDLRLALQQDLSGKTRVWVIAGNGAAETYPRADSIYRELSRDWKEVKSWDIPPYTLKLFAR